MSTLYQISGDCVSNLLYRLSQRFGDFEGLLYGSQNQITTDKLKDNGEYDSMTYQKIENAILIKDKKIIHLKEDFNTYSNLVPEQMQILGWVACRTELPCIPSIGDQSTFTYLSQLSSNSSNFSKDGLIFAIFTYKPSSATSWTEIQNMKTSNLVTFEYKFFKYCGNFEPIKVEIENLKETNTKYNSEQFTYSFFEQEDNEIQNRILSVPQALFQDCQNCILEIEELIPHARNLQNEIEKAQIENLRLKQEIYKKSV